jgi:hypothetical protein
MPPLGQTSQSGLPPQRAKARAQTRAPRSFLQPNWWGEAQAGVGTNRYAYAVGDPVNGVDPSGHSWWDLCIGESYVAGAVVAAITSLFVVVDAIDISNGGAFRDSPLGNPMGQVTHNATQGGAAIVGVGTMKTVRLVTR